MPISSAAPFLATPILPPTCPDALQVLTGALVGGPAGPGDDTYTDKRDDFQTNEVSCCRCCGLA